MKFLICLIGLALFVSIVFGSNIILSQANDDFGLRLLQNLEKTELTKFLNAKQNVFISPFSVGTSLAMLLAGGVNQTYTQIYNTLGFNAFNLTNSKLFHDYQNLTDELNVNTKSTANILNIANAIAVQKNFALNENFIGNITTFFEAQVFVDDFTANATKATEEINSWVSDKTHGKIGQLFDKPLLANTAIVLFNAVYFKGNWKTKFDSKKMQYNFYFHPENKNEVKPTVLYMTQTGTFNYAQLTDGQMIELPYENETLSIYVFLPPLGFNGSISSQFTAPKLEQAISQLQPQVVNLFLPKFKISQSYSLDKSLKTLGISDAFTGDANFFNINNDFNLKVSQIIHKTYLEVNEAGSEAPAASGVVFAAPRSSVNQSEIDFRADHPFLFLIRDKSTQLTISCGIVNNPGK